jgi:hypothetical protein
MFPFLAIGLGWRPGGAGVILLRLRPSHAPVCTHLALRKGLRKTVMGFLKFSRKLGAAYRGTVSRYYGRRGQPRLYREELEKLAGFVNSARNLAAFSG